MKLVKKKEDQEAKGHSAPFPCQLAEDHILSWSNKGDTVLDPMCGSGTFLIEAAIIAGNVPANLNRKKFGFGKSNEIIYIYGKN